MLWFLLCVNMVFWGWTNIGYLMLEYNKVRIEDFAIWVRGCQSAKRVSNRARLLIRVRVGLTLILTITLASAWDCHKMTLLVTQSERETATHLSSQSGRQILNFISQKINILANTKHKLKLSHCFTRQSGGRFLIVIRQGRISSAFGGRRALCHALDPKCEADAT